MVRKENRQNFSYFVLTPNSEDDLRMPLRKANFQVLTRFTCVNINLSTNCNNQFLSHYVATTR